MSSESLHYVGEGELFLTAGIALGLFVLCGFCIYKFNRELRDMDVEEEASPQFMSPLPQEEVRRIFNTAEADTKRPPFGRRKR